MGEKPRAKAAAGFGCFISPFHLRPFRPAAEADCLWLWDRPQKLFLHLELFPRPAYLYLVGKKAPPPCLSSSKPAEICQHDIRAYMKQIYWCNKLEDTEYLVEFLPIVQFVRLRRPDRLFLDRWTKVLLPILHPPPPHPPPEAREKNERRVCVRGRRRRMKEEEEAAGEKRCEEKMRRRRGWGGRESEGEKESSAGATHDGDGDEERGEEEEAACCSVLREADRSSPPFSSPLLPPRRGATELEDSLLRPPPVLLYSFRSRSDALAHPYCRTVRQRRRIFSRKQRKRRKSAAWKFGQPHPLKEVGKNLVSLSPSFARLSKNIRSNSPPLQLSRVLDPHPSSPHLLLPREMEVGFISRTAEEERERRPTPPTPTPPVLIPPSVWCLFCGACFFPPPISPAPFHFLRVSPRWFLGRKVMIINGSPCSCSRRGSPTHHIPFISDRRLA